MQASMWTRQRMQTRMPTRQRMQANDTTFNLFCLLNDYFDLRSIFTNKFVSMRSSKLVPILICLDDFFRLKGINTVYPSY
jgi:hypothetical protein